MLAKSGLQNNHFYYPYPDYKLPRVVVDENGFSTPDFNALDVLDFPTTDPSHENQSVIHEKNFLTAYRVT